MGHSKASYLLGTSRAKLSLDRILFLKGPCIVSSVFQDLLSFLDSAGLASDCDCLAIYLSRLDYYAPFLSAFLPLLPPIFFCLVPILTLNDKPSSVFSFLHVRSGCVSFLTNKLPLPVPLPRFTQCWWLALWATSVGITSVPIDDIRLSEFEKQTKRCHFV